MTTVAPALDLSHGQVLWALARGTQPQRPLIDQVRYLRRLGVPFRTAELGPGRGNRVRYRYEQLIELGVAVWALERGMKPQEAAGVLAKQRKYMRPIYIQAFMEQPKQAIEEPWVKSRGRLVPILGHEIFLRLHDRYSNTPGKIEMVKQDEIQSLSDLLLLTEKYPGEKARTLLPLTRLVLELVAWARDASELKPGR